jgi:NAD(P)H-flavin reductase
MMTPELYKVTAFKHEIPEVFTLELQGLTQDTLKFSPGQFCMLHMFGVGESAISISGAAHQDDKVIHTIKALGVVTNKLQNLREGAIIGLRGPYGEPWPIKKMTGKNVVIASGGLGLAPLRPVIYHIIKNRKKYKKVWLFYGARTPADILYADEIQNWADKHDILVRISVDKAEGNWQGNVGVVTPLIHKEKIPSKDVIALLCGPEIMMHFGVIELEKKKISKKDIYISMERNMQCGVGYCGHCIFGPKLICRDGPVFSFDEVGDFLQVREL